MTIEDVIKTKQMAIGTKTVINLIYTSRLVEEKNNTLFKEHDITGQQYNVLRILRGQKGNPANLSTLQERMVDKNSNTTRLVDKLISKELVKRQVCKQNRRKVEIFITPKGLELLAQLDPLTEASNALAIKNLNAAELETFNVLLDKLRDNE